MTQTRTYSLAALAKTHTVTIDDPERESGMAVVRKPIQLVRIEPYEKMVGSLIALYDDGRVYECHDGATAWNEVEMPQ